MDWNQTRKLQSLSRSLTRILRNGEQKQQTLVSDQILEKERAGRTRGIHVDLAHETESGVRDSNHDPGALHARTLTALDDVVDPDEDGSNINRSIFFCNGLFVVCFF